MTTIKIDSRSEKWIKEGRGKGVGRDYHPWLTVRDLPSEGRSHRVWGHRTLRTHHLLSDLELAVFLLLDWDESVTDSREQFPLRVDDTLDIAQSSGIRHPSMNGFVQIMSTDFVVDNPKRSPSKLAIQVKTATDLQDKRVIEKLEIERRYWERKGIRWYLVTDNQIPKTAVDNIRWLYPLKSQISEFDESLQLVNAYVDYFLKNPMMTLPQAAMALDHAYSLAPGESLKGIRSLLANRVLCFDVRRPWATLLVGDVEVATNNHSVGDRYASN